MRIPTSNLKYICSVVTVLLRPFSQHETMNNVIVIMHDVISYIW